uniref:Uncharacterized protein n=1 Tax=Grammatophora oceanica TaxID=210454 RepID=A0A7S1YLT9_9STRA|mmetsp:Transcript_8381/g.12257  ORF Transcript_8381/g.12257 Transcript_8381/m.12257 type:complete len:263 (+) Transcript_8381:191-979(+)|eukprot:CAMPEP_0194040858 /NCGR_PEP_ID=MMETSP0009_2-20130614/12799_1 /TAXON_ID=210454 /ORGANISM="Grammatophora oceanica, Strain CCMP 410" /LENGTH=262 /DNA_ID=CAMNT_0038684139 /DNA_START=186 /DNA_END=974 /DNA_ORIENTATION=-
MTGATATATTLLLDMDGVLAEVSKSYRAAIVATCHEYGAKSITVDTVSDWKAKGGCNNDWILSLDLIKSDPKGQPDVTLEQVTDTFESFYQGDNDNDKRPGLCELETLIPSMDTMKELRKRATGGVAIVTGRPRKDCNKFLKQYNLEQFVDHSVCMEDGKPKPDPFPIQRACELLGVEKLPSDKVIMVGDTPDDIRSAVAAGCIGVGVSTPEAYEEMKAQGKSHDEAKLPKAMKECGAKTILEPGFADLVDMFAPAKGDGLN